MTKTIEAVVRRRWLPPEYAVREVVAFERRFGEKHLALACHAALPLILTPELVNLIRINFLDSEDIPWIAESDLLLSPLCRPIQEDIYQVEPCVREALLVELEDKFGWRIPFQLADFLEFYLEKQPDWKLHPELTRNQKWIAKAYLNPDGTIQELMDELDKVLPEDNPVLGLPGQSYFPQLVEILAEPLERTNLWDEHQYLVNTTRVLAKLLSGEREELKEEVELEEIGEGELMLISPAIVHLLQDLEKDKMPGIPQLLKRLRNVLLECEQFESDRKLRTIFTIEPLLRPWRSSVPQADSLNSRVDYLIAFLVDKYRSDTKENVLVLFVRLLSEQIDKADERHQQLVDLASEVEKAIFSKTPTANFKQNIGTPVNIQINNPTQGNQNKLNNYKIFSDLEANNINQLESALQNLFIHIDTVAGRRAIFRNAGIDNYFIGNLDFNLGINEFITILVAKFKDYSVSRINPNHPLIQLADYILKQPQQKYNLDDENIEIFSKIYLMGLQENKILLTQSTNEILESDSENYLINISRKLINEGCLSPGNNVTYENQQFELVGKITNFELSFGLFNMRGDAFFIFSYFESINIKILRRYSNLCLKYATAKSTSSTVGQIINVRVPSNICFSIAVVDNLNEDTKNTIRTENPFDIDTDTLWYKVPVVYNLNEQRLYYYDRPSSFWENFKGEVVWKKLREVIEKILKP